MKFCRPALCVGVLSCVLLAVAASDAGARPIRLRNLVLPEKMSGKIAAPKVAGNARTSGLAGNPSVNVTLRSTTEFSGENGVLTAAGSTGVNWAPVSGWLQAISAQTTFNFPSTNGASYVFRVQVQP